MKKYIWLTSLGSFIFIISCILYINSANIIFDGWGNDFNSNSNYLSFIITGLILIFSGIIGLINKNKQNMNKNSVISIGLIGVINSFIPLSKLIDLIFDNNQVFNNENLLYFIWTVFGIFVLTYSIIMYFDNK